MLDGAKIYRDAFVDALQPPVNITVSEWADAHRILTRRSSSEPGKWRTDRVPYLREPMDMLSPQERKIRRVVMMFGSQTAKTEAGLNWLGKTIAQDPGPFLMMFPTEPFAKRQIRQRFTPLFNDTPAIKEKQLSSKSRDSANAMFLKEFQGDMLLSIIGSNSGSAAQGMPAEKFWADEVSSNPLEMDDKGDPLENAEARTSNFPNKKVLITSTPGTRGACRITWEYEERSDRRRYNVLMPCCNSHLVLLWREHMVWDTPEGEVFCQCPVCGERVAEHHKTTMLSGGIWRPTATGDGTTAGFHLPGWYAPYGWTSWEEIRDEFLRAKNDPLLLKGWQNKRAAEAWEDITMAKVNADVLLERAAKDAYPTGHCPAGVLVLLMSVDVQDTWLEVAVWGFGRDEETWLVWHEKIEGDPGQNPEGKAGRGGPWMQIDAIRRTEFPLENGGSAAPRMCGVDTGGHFTHEAYEYCRLRARDGVKALKGANSRDAMAVSKGNEVDVNHRGKLLKKGVVLYMTGGHNLKRTIYNRLKNEVPGPGYVHFGQNATLEFLEGLTCERLIPTYVKGFQVLTWDKPQGARNEPLDLLVYALALLELVKRKYSRATLWDQLEAEVLKTKSAGRGGGGGGRFSAGGRFG